MFPVIYLNLSKSKRYLNKKDSDDDSSSEVVSPCKDSESDGELIKLDGESLQAAYDLLALCSLQGSSSKDRNKEICLAAHCQEHDLSTNTFSKVEIHEDKRTTHFETPGNKR
ncbi:unnamed protein product [Peronospora belbahrii]|nr:unnamed protein product [Peronospora belbahrii]